MQVTSRLGLLLLVGAAAVSSCGKRSQPTSALSDIGSDISTGGATVLYWAQDANVFRGTCEKDKPLLRGYCQRNVVTRKAADASVAIYGNSQAKHDQLTRDKNELTAQLAAIDDALSKDPTNPDLSGERERVALELRKVTQGLAAVDQYYNLAKSFIEKLTKSDIVYKITAGSDRYDDLKPLVQALASFFNAVPPPQPDATWTDTATKRTFAAIKDRYTWAGASAACQLIQKGTWIAITGYLSGNCNDSPELGKRLFTSPIMDVIPTTKIDTAASKVVWSRCFYEGGQPIAVGLDNTTFEDALAAKLKHYGLASNTGLPVLCERIKQAAE